MAAKKTKKTKRATDSISPEHFLTDDEVKKLKDFWYAQHLVALEKGTKYAINSWLLVDLMLSSGARISEVGQLRVGDCAVERKPYYLCIIGKGNRTREVYISDRLSQHIRQYVKWRQLIGDQLTHESPLLRNKRGGHLSKYGVSYLWRSCCKQAGIRIVRPHASRHTFASRLLRKSGDLQDVRHQLGHRSIGTTSRYLHSDPQRLSRVMNEMD